LRGETEKLEPALNQLARTQTANRLVFTIDKYSIVDIFDTNIYPHDARNDFLDWPIVDQGAFDYAANIWRYIYGGTGEWYQDWWTIRVGVFDCRNDRTASRCPMASVRGCLWSNWRKGRAAGSARQAQTPLFAHPAAT
jgi:hypothetical protein